MPKEVRVVQEDLPVIKEMYDAIATALNSFPQKTMENDKFCVLAITAIFNAACRLALDAGVQKEDFIGSIAKVWDDKAATDKDKSWN
jgi:hypothetical protein